MKIGDRIKKYRKIRKVTQLDLGYHIKLNDIRIAQYETGKRNPKENVINNIAQALDIEPAALKNNDIDSINGLLHLLFELEDVYGLTIKEKINETFEHFSSSNFIFQFKPKDLNQAYELTKAFKEWVTAYEKYHPITEYETEQERQIAEDKYTLWKAQYPNNYLPEHDTYGKTCREDRDWKL